MFYTLKQLHLESLLLGLHDVHGAVTEYVRKSVVDLGAGEE